MTATDRFDLLRRDCGGRSGRPGDPRLKVRRVHLLAAKLRGADYVQHGLFDEPDEAAEAVGRVKREVNAEVGRFALRSGATLYLDEVYKDKAQDFDICDIHGKICF